MKMQEITEGRLWAQTNDFMTMEPPPAVYAKYAVSHSQFPELKVIKGNIQALVDNKQDLAQLQQWLNSNGYDAGAVDGTWGPQTLAALQAFNQHFVNSYNRAKQQRDLARFFRVVDAVMFVANPAAFVGDKVRGAATNAALGAVTNAVRGTT
jgi:hypothetical protein